MNVTLSRKELLAALLFASTDESRYVLNGILLESGNGKPRMITTDGRRLSVIETVAEQSSPSKVSESAVLRSDVAKHLCGLSKALGGKLNPWMEFYIQTEQVTVSFVGTTTSVKMDSGAIIPAPFPDWRKIVPPKNAERKPFNDLGLNSEYLGDYASAAKFLEAKSSVISMNLVGKESAIEVRLEAVPTLYSLIMPCKTQEDVEYQPEFLCIAKQFPPPNKEEAANADQ